MLPSPIKYRREIPFYYDKTETEFRQDPYEQYVNMVTRQMRLHLATEPYPFAPCNQFIFEHLPQQPLENVADVGCGVGKLIGSIAQQFPIANCYGVDYSYQLLKVANDFFVNGKQLKINDLMRGFPAKEVTGLSLRNVQFLLAKAEQLPFPTNSLSAICSNFTLDRFQQPKVALEEFYRCLKIGGRAIITTPLNFQHSSHWQHFFPLEKLVDILSAIGFTIITTNESIDVFEPLDRHDNAIQWKTVGIVLEK